MEGCAHGPWRFWRRVPRADGSVGGGIAEAAGHRGHLVSAAVFTFAAAYRPSHKYAKGLLWLSESVRAHMPGFTLRIYCDASLEPAKLRAAKDATAADAWSEAFAELERQPHVNIVWYTCAPFALPDGSGHVELFGTFPRFIPLFGAGAAVASLPPWAGAPPDGSIVFCADVDFGDYATEHAMLHAMSWYAALPMPAAEAGAIVAGAAGGTAGVVAPQLLGLSAAGSTAARHEPACGLPPFYSGLIAARVRLPASLLDGFLADAAAYRQGGAAAAKATLLPRYIAAVHAAERQNFTFTKRRMGEQSLFPFGIDEFFLTNALKPATIARGVVAAVVAAGTSTRSSSGLSAAGRATAVDWLFLTIPSVDTEMRTPLSLVAETLEKRAAVPGGVFDVLLPLGEAVGQRAAVDTARTAWSKVDGAAAAKVAAEQVKAWAGEWPKLATAATGLWSAFPGHFSVLDGSVAAPLAGGVRSAIAASLSLCATGALVHTDKDVALMVQQLEHFAHAAPGLVAAHHYRVGDGRAVHVDGSATASSLLAAVASAKGCGVAAPPRTRSGSGAATGAYRSPLDAAGAAAIPSPADAAAAFGSTSVAAAGSSSAGAAVAAAASAPAAAAGVVPVVAGWELRTSRSTGKLYWFQAATGRSFWHDPALPAGWAWGQDKPDLPKYYVHLATGAQRQHPPVEEEDTDAAAVEPAAKRRRIE